MAIFPEYFRNAILSKDFAAIKKSIKKLLEDLDNLVNKAANYKYFEKDDEQLITEIKNLYKYCKSEKEQKIISHLIYIAHNLILRIDVIRRQTNFKIPNRKILESIYKDLQDLLNEELSFENLMRQKITYTEKHPGVSLASFDPETRLIKLGHKIPPQFRRYIKIHEICDYRASAIPRLIQEYAILSPIFKEFASFAKIYFPSKNIYESAHYMEAHIVGVYEEFRAAKREGMLDAHFNWILDAYKGDISPRGAIVKHIWRAVYNLVR